MAISVVSRGRRRWRSVAHSDNVQARRNSTVLGHKCMSDTDDQPWARRETDRAPSNTYTRGPPAVMEYYQNGHSHAIM